MRTSRQFMEHFSGLPGNILTTACTRACTDAVDYSKCAKIDMADAYVNRNYGIGKVDISVIDTKVIEMYLAVGQVSAAQSLAVFRWLRKAKLIEETQQVSRRTR